MRYIFVEIFGLFWLTPKTPEWPKNDPKNSKNCKIFQFYAIFVKLSINFLALKVENNTKRKKLWSKRLFQRKKCNFLMKKKPQIETQNDKKLKNSELLNKEKIRCPEGFLEEIKICFWKNASNSDRNWQKKTKIQIFENFMQFLRTFRKTWWLRMLKTFSKEQIRCRGCFVEEIKAIGVEKKASNPDRNWQKHKKSQLLKVLCSFCVILENLGGFEFQRRSTRNKFVVRKAFFRK